MSSFEDEDHREVLPVEQRSGEHVVLSRAAFELSAFAMAASVRNDTPGFIAEEHLSSETSLTAMELVVSGQWLRVEGGYEIADPEERALAIRLHRQQVNYDDWPLAPEDCTAHIDGPNSRGRCIRCGTPVEYDDDEDETGE